MLVLLKKLSPYFMKENNIYLLKKNIDKESFEIAFSKYWERLYCYCFKMTSDRELSENIVQDIFIDLWSKRKKTTIADIEKYLFRSVKFQVFNYYRNKNVNREILLERYEECLEENQEQFLGSTSGSFLHA